MDSKMVSARYLHFLRAVFYGSFIILMIAPLRAGVTYDTSKHGNPDTGVFRNPSDVRGACAQCHESHGSRDGVPNGGTFDHTLFRTDDETLCYECHTTPGAHEIYPGNLLWADSTHALSPAMYWPGPVPAERNASDAGKCVNCHDPHGADDANGVIPSMLRLREETLCYGCHDGSPSKDIKAQFARTYRHPVATTARHDATEGTSVDPARFGATPDNNRHAECADCHNTHVARADAIAPLAPEASQRIVGVARIEVLNGAAGTRPVYTWRGAGDLSLASEYQICFKCHSSWTELPAVRSDHATLTNPNNPSFHPIQAEGKNRNIAPEAFANGWTWDRLVYCSDCHGSDDPFVRGPHGSSFPSILKASYPASPAPRTMVDSDLCFSCHRYDVYANAGSANATQQASRFNGPNGRGHAFHIGEQQVPCYACHTTHGSTTRPSLIVTGRNPGITSYTQSAAGGTCTATCHGSQSYSVNYPR
ncbi:MAG: hypothetical protein JJE51_12760 [Thermoanaerobaculia bacterium]|nr:hypothetical protein [Thermoanaerobaculia bacterium]